MPKGTIVLIPFPFTDLSGQKIRPALVLQNVARSEDCIVAFISSVESKKTNTFGVAIAPSKENGLKKNSTVRVDKIATLQKKIILGELGTIEKNLAHTVATKLKLLFEI